MDTILGFEGSLGTSLTTYTRKTDSYILQIQGVVACDPEDLDVPLPSSATELRIGAWVLSGNSILKDGRSIQVNNDTIDYDFDKTG